MAKVNKVAYDPEKVDWKKLCDFGNHLKIFKPTPEKVEHIFQHLLKGYLNMSDEFRQPTIIGNLLQYYFVPRNDKFHLFYEINNFAGIIGFTDISIGYKASLLFKFWDKSKKQFNIVTFREIDRLLSYVMKTFDLKRLSFSTPDKNGEDLAKKFGFTVEGTQKYGFLWNSKLRTNINMRLLREV